MLSILILRNAKEAQYQYNVSIPPFDVGVYHAGYFETLGER